MSFGQNKRYKKCTLFSFVSSNSTQFFAILIGAEAHGSSKTEHVKTELFAEIVKVWRLLVIFAKSSILDVRHGPEYTSA